MKFIFACLMIVLVRGKGNIDTTSFWRVKPPSDERPIKFGASLAIKR